MRIKSDECSEVPDRTATPPLALEELYTVHTLCRRRRRKMQSDNGRDPVCRQILGRRRWHRQNGASGELNLHGRAPEKMLGRKITVAHFSSKLSGDLTSVRSAALLRQSLLLRSWKVYVREHVSIRGANISHSSR